MTLACPVCKATNPGSTCRRCKSDLSDWLEIDQQWKGAIARSWAALQNQDFSTAAHELDQAEMLKKNEQTAVIRAFLHCLLGQTDLAWPMILPHVKLHD